MDILTEKRQTSVALSEKKAPSINYLFNPASNFLLLGGGEATQIPSTINTTAKTVFVSNVFQFSDWTLAQPVALTAATVGGRVANINGRGISLARVTMTDNAGNIRTAITNPFGYYSFDGVATGANYIFNVSHKQYRFPRGTQAQSVIGDETVDFIAVSNSSGLVNH